MKEVNSDDLISKLHDAVASLQRTALEQESLIESLISISKLSGELDKERSKVINSQQEILKLIIDRISK